VKPYAPRAWVTWSLVAAIAVVHALLLTGVDVGRLSLQPAAFAPWQLLTYGLVHASAAHLLANGACLAIAGPRVEYALGASRHAALLAACVATGGLAQAVATWAGAVPPASTVGASGAVYGLLVASWVVRRPAAPVPASAAVYGGLAIAAIVGGRSAAYAHLGGMAGAWVLVRALRPPLGCQTLHQL
jgi:membrane associated rhomboid family serine protease